MAKEYIEREAAIEWFMAFVHMGESDIPAETVIADLKYAIPAADVAPVRYGNWKEWWPGIAAIMTGEEMLYRCSACDAKYADIDGYKYCPYCGAEMDKEANSDTERTD